jgi:NADH:ubiquinone oxidoreductase subunit 6 (subunit J)
MENQPQKKQHLKIYIKTLYFLFMINLILSICKLSNKEFINNEYLGVVFTLIFGLTILLFFLIFRENLISNKENTIRNLKKIGKILLTRILFFGGLFAVLYYFLHRN